MKLEAVNQKRCFPKRDVLRNVAKFTGKHLFQSLFFNKVVGQACNFIKKETLAQVFSGEFCEIFENTFCTEHIWWLLRWTKPTKKWIRNTSFWCCKICSCRYIFPRNCSNIVDIDNFYFIVCICSKIVCSDLVFWCFNREFSPIFWTIFACYQISSKFCRTRVWRIPWYVYWKAGNVFYWYIFHSIWRSYKNQ